MSGWHSRGDIIGPDGLSRLTFGQAVWGEREKGVTDPVEIARNVLDLYRADWLERELGKPLRELPKRDHAVVNAIFGLPFDLVIIGEAA